MYKLVIADEEGSASTVPVIRDEITIGRQEGNTIRLTERDVSRRHARVIRENDRVFIEGVAARYGVKKNGVKIDKRVEFAPGDVVSIGSYQLTLQSKAGAAPEAGAASMKRRPEDSVRGQGTQVLPAMPAKLVVVSSNFAGQEFPLNRQEMIIGRGEDCDIIIDHRSVSQRHAKVIRQMGNRYQIVDLNSKNGVVVGGETYRTLQIKRGDVLELGHVKFRFVEPGENYVFTPQPQAIEDGAGFSGEKSDGSNPLIWVALLGVLLLAAGGAFMLFSSGEQDAPDGDEAPVAVAPAEAGSEGEAGAAVADSQAIAEAADDSKAGQAIQEAREEIRAGNLDKAIGALNSAEKYLNPTAEQKDAIAELLGAANRERPFKQHYDSATNYLKSEDYAAALDRLSQIPEHSIFYQLSKDEGLSGEALDGLVASAKSAAQAQEADKARDLAEEALLYDDEHVGALALVASLDEQKEKPASASTSSAGSRPSTTSSGRAPAAPPAKAKPAAAPQKVTPEQAREYFSSAQQKFFKNDTAGTIADCQKGLRGGHSACYKLIALAHKKQGDNAAACKNFKRYLGTSPSDAAAVQAQVQQLGCD